MAVYTELDEDFICYMLSVYPEAGELRSYAGVSAGSINTTYRLETSRGVFYLRVAENKAFSDLIYEKNLLRELERRAPKPRALHSPRMVPNAARGYFFPLPNEPGATSKYACLFEGLAGRELASFERDASHVRQLGRALASLHRQLRGFRGRRKNPYRLSVVAAWVESLRHRPIPQDVQEWMDQERTRLLRERRPLPRGVIHGDLFMNNTKWARGTLTSIFDWEMAGRDHLMLDVGICLNAWTWQREAGGRGEFDEALGRALIEGYAEVRPLAASERRGLFVETRIAALRFMASRIRDFGTDGPATPPVVTPIAVAASAATAGPVAATGMQPAARAPDAQRDFLDYREYAERSRRLMEMGATQFRRRLGL